MNIDDLLIKAVLFDFDGTLTKPGALDFSVIKASLGCPADIPVLEFIRGIRDENQRREATNELDTFEALGAVESEPAEGTEALIRFLRTEEIPVGIISRNSRQSIERALNNFSHIKSSDFDLIISRDDSLEPKPDPAGVLYAAKYFRYLRPTCCWLGIMCSTLRRETGRKHRRPWSPIEKKNWDSPATQM